MNKKFDLLIVLLSAVIITLLFHRQVLGLNLFLFEIILFLGFIVFKQYKFSGKNQLTFAIGFLLTSLFTVLTHSVFSYFIHFIALIVFIGAAIYPEVKSTLNSIALSFSNLVFSQIRFAKELTHSSVKGYKFSGFIRKFKLFVIPLIIILLFIFIYRMSNPVFDKLFGSFGLFFQKYFGVFFQNFDALIIVTFIVGLIISNFLFLRTQDEQIIKDDLKSNVDLERKRSIRKNIKLIALKNEYKAAIFLLIMLNAILFIVNAIDVNWIWFNFKWEGQYLKQFVHEGTYLLILSILISIALVLYFFRGNINFYSNNKLLKYLSYIWIAQNGILTVSVAIRNFYYIDYFSLAYKRIAVIIFLALTIYGLYTVLIKVKQRKSTFFLFKSNSYAIYVMLVCCSLINWDSIIAQYNFKHANKSFLHLNYLSTLSDKSLPYLDKSLTELSEIDKIQKEKFTFEQKYMKPETYFHIIEKRKISFIHNWESKSLLSWNLPEYLAYKKLKETH
jgi:hypothetical protein